MDQQVFQRIQDMQHAANFLTLTEDGFGRIVDAPYLNAPIASAFERISRFEDPIVELARLGTHKVHNICWGIDVIEDSLDDIDMLRTWTREGTLAIRLMAGGRA
ncbi:MAG: hypothetical protein IJI68_14020 [Eggerthellaceae bacterium]|nr:hypothetical protein [Eggerthellaceae bacterium]